MTYNPTQYWEERGKTYTSFEDPIKQEEYKIIDRILKGEQVLEVGSGHGQSYKQLSDVDEYSAVDISSTMIENFLKNFPDVLVEQWDGKTLPYDDNSVESILLFDVTQHVPPSDIEAFIKEMFRVATKRVLIAAFETDEDLHPHNFSHDYCSILAPYIEVIEFHKGCSPIRKLYDCHI